MKNQQAGKKRARRGRRPKDQGLPSVPSQHLFSETASVDIPAAQENRGRKRKLDQLNQRLCKKPPASRTGQDLLLAYLRRNIDSQRILAEWQQVLRHEQEILLSQMSDNY